ncbi:MAG: type IX secretion system plug protein [Bacteroidia bacterium]
MKLNFQYSFFLFLFVSFLSSFSQDKKTQADEDYVDPNRIRYEDRIYVPNIKSVLIHDANFVLAPAQIDLDAGERIEFSFDDLDGDNKNYWYTVVHCDAIWKPSDLMPQEYLGGFMEEQINNFAFSAGTMQKYTHYRWTFPNNNLKITKSGNYLLKVYLNGNKDKVVLTRRFMVFSNKVSVTGNVHQGAGADDFMNKQEVDFSILYSGYNITNPFTDLKVVVQQNSRWDNALYDLKPIFTKPNELTYDYDDGTNCFNAGNEFRNVNLKNLKFITQYTNKIYRDSLLTWHLEQKPEEVKTFKKYWQYPDINGRCLLTVEERDTSTVTYVSEYVKVHFSMPFDYPMVDGNFYVMGNLSDNQFSLQNKMSFNYFKKAYECDLYLKQGYYDYQIMFLEDGKLTGDETLIEGNHWETENDYTIYVYHRQFGTYYDQLICIRKLNSIRK